MNQMPKPAKSSPWKIIVLVGCGVLLLIPVSCIALGAFLGQYNSARTRGKGEPSAQVETARAAEEAPKAKGHAPGMYKVGVDLPEGEYALLGDGSHAYFQVTRDSTGDMRSIICNDNFVNRSILTVKVGQYVTVQGAWLVPFTEAPKVQPEGGRLPQGMYKVGLDLAPGEYKIVSDGHGYVERSRNSTHSMHAIVSNDNFEGERYISVSAGQYLKLQGCELILKK